MSGAFCFHFIRGISGTATPAVQSASTRPVSGVTFRDAIDGSLCVLVGLASLSAVARAQGPTRPDSSGSIVGVVVARETGAPLPYSVVSLPALGRERFTNERGEFLLTGVPAGSGAAVRATHRIFSVERDGRGERRPDRHHPRRAHEDRRGAQPRDGAGLGRCTDRRSADGRHGSRRSRRSSSSFARTPIAIDCSPSRIRSRTRWSGGRRSTT